MPVPKIKKRGSLFIFEADGFAVPGATVGKILKAVDNGSGNIAFLPGDESGGGGTPDEPPPIIINFNIPVPSVRTSDGNVEQGMFFYYPGRLHLPGVAHVTPLFDAVGYVTDNAFTGVVELFPLIDPENPLATLTFGGTTPTSSFAGLSGTPGANLLLGVRTRLEGGSVDDDRFVLRDATLTIINSFIP